MAKTKKPKRRTSLADSVERMLSNCAPVGDCMVWKGATMGLSGIPAVNLTIEGKKVQRSARRVMWQLKTRKPVPRGVLVAVSCEHPGCLEHLCLTNRSEVTRKAVSRPEVRAKLAVARRKQLARDGVKVSLEKARQIRSDPRPHTTVAREEGVSITYVKLIRRGERRLAPSPFAALVGAR